MRGMSFFAYCGKNYDEATFTEDLNEFNRDTNVNVTPSQVLYWAIHDGRDLLVTQIYEFVIRGMEKDVEMARNDELREVKIAEIEEIKKRYKAFLSRELRRH